MKRTITFILFIFCFMSVLDANKKEEELKTRVVNGLPSLEGWCSREKALNFIDLVLQVQPQICVDIGSFGGSSVFPVASALKYLGQGVVIAIDPWDRVECIKHFDPVAEQEHLIWWGKLNLDYIYKSYLNMITRFSLEKYCITIRGTSEKAASQIDAIDILYIDGNPSEEISLFDVVLYLPKVKPGGYIWFNDSLSANRQSAVELLSNSCEVIKLIDNGNCILFKKGN